MNKKGYTLIEIIVVITLLAIIGTGTIIGGIRINKINKEKEREKLIDKIKVSADVYSTNTKYLSQLENNSYVYVPITELIDSGYLDEVINPLTKEEIYKETDYDKVLIKKDYMGTITIQYPLHDVEELIELDPLIIYKGETFDCNLGLDAPEYNSIKNSIGFTCIIDSINFNNTTDTQNIKYKYTDNDKIYRTTYRKLIIKNDDTPPTIELNPNSNYFVNINVSVYDNETGINEAYYCWKSTESGNCSSDKTTISTLNQTILRNHTTADYLYIYAMDNRGNLKEQTKKYNFNPLPPTINVNPFIGNGCYTTAASLPKINFTTNMNDNNFKNIIIKSNGAIKKTISSSSSSYNYQVVNGDKNISIELTYITPYNETKTIKKDINKSFNISTLPTLSYNTSTNQLSANLTNTNILYSYDKINYFRSDISAVNNILSTTSNNNIYVKLSNGCNADKVYRLEQNTPTFNINSISKGSISYVALAESYGGSCDVFTYEGKVLKYFNDGTFIYMFPYYCYNKNCGVNRGTTISFVDLKNNINKDLVFINGIRSGFIDVKLVKKNDNEYYIYTKEYRGDGAACKVRDPYNLSVDGCPSDYDYYDKYVFQKYKFIRSSQTMTLESEIIPFDIFKSNCSKHVDKVLNGGIPSSTSKCNDGTKYRIHFNDLKDDFYDDFVNMNDTYIKVDSNIIYDEYYDGNIDSEIKTKLCNSNTYYQLRSKDIIKYSGGVGSINNGTCKIWESNTHYYVNYYLDYPAGFTYQDVMVGFPKTSFKRSFTFTAIN